MSAPHDVEQKPLEELQRLKTAEELLELRDKRRSRTSRLTTVGQSMLAYIALAGFFANAYQSCVNKKQQDEAAEREQGRWAQEFKRAQEADKHRAFFETSILATDKENDDKRLVGYTLLQEFVADPDFNFKATLMLEESLAQELKKNEREVGLDDSVRVQIVAIVTALSQTRDCDRLQRAALSIDRVAQRQLKVKDAVESGEVFNVYVRRLIGRAAIVCNSMHEFRLVRAPIRDTLRKLPGIGQLSGNVTAEQANTRIAEILRQKCDQEIETSGASDCKDAYKGWAELCKAPPAVLKSRDGGSAPDGDPKDEAGSCQVMSEALVELAH
ncbi:MAG: hypothetical protein IPJ65_02450 [Archangiaceae bacterium]|nr:hypothetical protein [Archangiaceae bacterium]